jgi:site-specific DNA-methyltransferase (adenine-specific)
MPEYMEHPSQKPELLLERIILTSSNIGDLVLDPFAGSFTTNAVSVKLGRNSIGIEVDPEYFQKGVDRVRATRESQEIANKRNYRETPQAVDLFLFRQQETLR